MFCYSGSNILGNFFISGMTQKKSRYSFSLDIHPICIVMIHYTFIGESSQHLVLELRQGLDHDAWGFSYHRVQLTTCPTHLPNQGTGHLRKSHQRTHIGQGVRAADFLRYKTYSIALPRNTRKPAHSRSSLANTCQQVRPQTGRFSTYFPSHWSLGSGKFVSRMGWPRKDSIPECLTCPCIRSHE